MQQPFFYGMSLFGLINAMGPSQAGLTKGHDSLFRPCRRDDRDGLEPASYEIA
jgi:hypothetical protein